MVLLILVGICVVLVISWIWKVLNWVWLKPRKLEKCLRQQGINGRPYKFLKGNVEDLGRMMMEARSKPMELSHRIVPRVIPFIHEGVEKYGKFTFDWRGPTLRVNIMDPELIKEVFSNKYYQYSKTKVNPYLKLIVTGLVSHDGDTWARHRRIINPAFHLEKLKLMLPAFHTCCSELVSKWQKLVSGTSCELDVWPDFEKLTASVISRAAFGSSYEQGERIFQLQTQLGGLIMQALQSVYIPGISWYLPTKQNNTRIKIEREMQSLLTDIIKKREEAMKLGEACDNDLLGLLLESNLKEKNSKNVGMSIDEVIDECKLFYFAGQETTSTLLVWTMIVLSMHPDWQEKAREEVLQLFGKDKPEFEGLNHLKIVTMILYEVLRLYPPVVVMTRTANRNMKLGEVYIPKGVQIALPTLLMHHSRELWGEDAEEFNPERFSEGISKATKNQVIFMPFGGGPWIISTFSNLYPCSLFCSNTSTTTWCSTHHTESMISLYIP
ncbi:Cytochrome p450 [Thalictrum thalictroides]|uniref:Cytochrome p450 n=1 Tax=Thalictrum thalictroides TaxID=46969 RepID=A0A7J6WQF0_THATH|nr:Cytochrome p450 [Thalictrum thalictroides]